MVYFSVIFFMFIISDRRFTPLGHINVHFPHSMQLFKLLSTSLNCPRRNEVWVLLMLNGVNCPAEHVAVHPPHPIHKLYDGTFSNSWFSMLMVDSSSKFIERGMEIEKPNRSLIFNGIFKF